MTKYEIFQKLPSRQIAWVEAATTLQEAKERLSELRLMFSGEYFIFDRENACFVLPQDQGTGQTARAEKRSWVRSSFQKERSEVAKDRSPLTDYVTYMAEREYTEQVRRESQVVFGHLRLMMYRTATPLSRCSRSFRYLWVNQFYAEWLGRPVEKIIGRPILDVLGHDCFGALRNRFDLVLSGNTVAYEENVTINELGRRRISAAYIPALDKEGVPDGWMASVQDITESPCVGESRSTNN